MATRMDGFKRSLDNFMEVRSSHGQRLCIPGSQLLWEAIVGEGPAAFTPCLFGFTGAPACLLCDAEHWTIDFP